MGLSHSPSIVTDGLVFCFDPANTKAYTGTGTVATEQIKGLVGAVEGGATFSSSLNGYFSYITDDYIRIPNDTSLDNQTFSVDVWAKTNNTTQNGFWFEKGTVNSQYALFQEGTTIKWRAHNGSLQNMVAPTTATYIGTSDWFHIVATCTSGAQVVWIDTVSAGTGTTAGTFSTNSGGMSMGAYGGYTGSHSYFYDGDIGPVKVYNKVLTEEEVNQNFNAVRARYGI